MKSSTFVLVALFFAGIFSTQFAKADEGSEFHRRPERQFVQCQSWDFNTQYCYVRGRVESAELIYQLSRTSCNFGSTWGYDDRGVWVSGGCRANFYVYTRY